MCISAAVARGVFRYYAQGVEGVSMGVFHGEHSWGMRGCAFSSCHQESSSLPRFQGVGGTEGRKCGAVRRPPVADTGVCISAAVARGLFLHHALGVGGGTEGKRRVGCGGRR